MARLTRQVGIRSAQVRLPGPSSAGPAVVKTAMSAVNQQFEKQADLRSQEAAQAAAKLNFERDGDGNLVSPSLPLTEDGLLAPSIYDRKYTQMVGQRYVNQIKIDTAKQLNTIATEHWDDPVAFQQVAEAYVNKVTELAPDRIKPDVNMTAQAKMVEHFNHITRVKAERDHSEAKGVHMQSMNDDLEELSGYIRSGADPELIAAAKNRYLAKILEGGYEGEGFNFFTEDEAAKYIDLADKAVAFNSLLRDINNVPDDEVAYAVAIQQMEDLGKGEGKLEVPNELGELVKKDISDVFDPSEIEQIAGAAKSLLAQRATSFGNLKDAKLERDWTDFYNWWSGHKLAAITPGTGVTVDINRLYEEFDKAHRNVMNNGYDDQLREEIRRLIANELGTDDGSWSKERQNFDDIYRAYWRMYGKEADERLEGRDPSSMTPEELNELDFDTEMTVGNIAGGQTQTAGNSKFIGEYYSSLSGRELHGDDGYDYWNQALTNPTPEQMAEIQNMANHRFNKIGLWSQEMSAAILSKARDVAGMNQQSLDTFLGMTRMFWDEPTFRYNMQDSNALGSRVGRALNHMFHNGINPTPEEAAKILQDFSDTNYQPYANYDGMLDDQKEKFESSMDNAISRYFAPGFWGGREGVQLVGDWNPFDKDMTGVPVTVRNRIKDRVRNQAGNIDTDDPDQFIPFIHGVAQDSLHEMGYAPSRYGYDAGRFSPDYWFNMTMPDNAPVAFSPEYFLRNENDQIDLKMVDRFGENFQAVLDDYDRKMNNGYEADGETPKKGWKPMFVAGRNAAVEYNPEASTRLGLGPAYNVMIIRDDGTPQYAFDDRGDLALITLNEVFEWKKKQDKLRSNEITNRTGQMRTDWQTGEMLLDPMTF